MRAEGSVAAEADKWGAAAGSGVAPRLIGGEDSELEAAGDGVVAEAGVDVVEGLVDAVFEEFAAEGLAGWGGEEVFEFELEFVIDEVGSPGIKFSQIRISAER